MEKELLENLNKTLEEVNKTLSEKKKSGNKEMVQWVTVAVTLLGILVTLIWNVRVQQNENSRAEKQEEAQLILQALEQGKNGKEKKMNLELLCELDLIAEKDRERISGTLEQSIVTHSGELYFINEVTANRLFLWADEYADAEDYEEAVKLLTMAIERDDTKYDFYRVLGFCYIRQNMFDKCIEAYTKALNTESRDKYAAYNGRGDAHYYKNDDESACKDYKKALKEAVKNGWSESTIEKCQSKIDALDCN